MLRNEWRIRSLTKTDQFDGKPLYWNKERKHWTCEALASNFSESEQAAFPKLPKNGVWEFTPQFS